MCIGGAKEAVVCKMKAKHRRRRWAPGFKVRLKKMMKCVLLAKVVRADEIAKSSESSLATRDYSASGYSARVGETDAKTNTSNIEEAESTLRESGFLNYEVCLSMPYCPVLYQIICEELFWEV